jgi:DNA primase
VAQIPKETIEHVLAATDIADLIASYIPLKRIGANYKGLCPFHNEKTPSFTINTARQSFHCFGCKKGGNAITFVREYENLPFTEAVRKLAARASIPIIEEEYNPKAEEGRRSRGRLLDLHREAAAFFHELLLKAPAAKHARDYLRSRGYGSEMAIRWSVGWMPDNPKTFLDWARSKSFTGRELVASGIAAQRDETNPRSGLYVRFRDRLMFPIRNEIGDVIAFSGRQLREDPNSGKYINSPETALFKKSNVLFALDRAKKPILDQHAALLCEGQIDVIACHEQGISHALAPLGTAFTTQHARLLRRYTKTVILCFDADSAGFTAAERAFRELAPEGLAVKVVEMPAKEDPDSFLKSYGPDAFRELLANAREFFDFKLDRAISAGALQSAATRSALANEAAALLATINDPLSRDALINHVATRLQIGPAELRDATKLALSKPRRPTNAPAAPAQATTAPTPLDNTIAYLCHLALESADVQNWLCEQLESLHEAADFIEGIPLLESILSNRPDPASAASVNAFLSTLPESDRLALTGDHTFIGPPDENARQSAESSLARLAAKVLLRRDARIKAALAEPGLPPERLLALLEESKEISLLLKGIDQRFIFNDRQTSSSRTPRPRKTSYPNQRNT